MTHKQTTLTDFMDELQDQLDEIKGKPTKRAPLSSYMLFVIGIIVFVLMGMWVLSGGAL